MAATTDVRQWAREHGYKIGDRGAVPADIHEAYDNAHRGPVLDGTGLIVESGAPGDDDFPGPADPDPPADGAGYVAAPAPPPPAPDPAADGPAPDERPPRDVRGRRGGRGGRRRGGWLSSWAARGRRRGRGRARGPRVPLGNFAEETWLDLAWLAEPVPPLAMMLEMQAPYAGVVFDEQVAGTPVDDLLQPLARYNTVFRALNGLLGPPVAVLMICLDGAYDEQGRPDGRTRMMFGMLRYSLAQMLRVSELSEAEVSERAQAIAERGRVVDAIITRLFAIPGGQPQQPPADGAAQQPAPAPGAPAAGMHVMQYPRPPVMDSAGADPARGMLGCVPRDSVREDRRGPPAGRLRGAARRYRPDRVARIANRVTLYGQWGHGACLCALVYRHLSAAP